MISSRVLALILGAYATTVLILAPPAAQADEIDQRQTAAVRFCDLKLDTRAGARMLFERIQTAAREVCEIYGPRGNAVPSAAHHACMKSAVAGAVRQIDSPLLRMYYDNQYGRSLNVAAR